MNVQFKTSRLNDFELKVLDGFCEEIVKQIQMEIYISPALPKVYRLEQDLLNARWMNWTDKPDHLNMKKVVNLLIFSITYSRGKDMVTISIPNDKKLPYSKNKLEQIARFLDLGNEISPATTFMSRVFDEYNSNINKYWKEYIKHNFNGRKANDLIQIKGGTR